MNSFKIASPSFKKRLPGISLGILSELSQVFLLILSMWLIVRAAEQPPILFLTFAIVGVRAFALGRAALRYLERLSAHNVVFEQLTTLRAWSFEKLIPLTPVGIADKTRGEVLSRLVDDLDELQNEALRFKNPVIISLASITISIVVIAFLSPLAALILTLGIVIFGGLGALFTARVTVRAAGNQAALKGALSEAILNRAENALELEVFGALTAENKKITSIERQLNGRQMRAMLLNGATAAFTTLGSGAITLLLIYFVANDFLLSAGQSAPSAPVIAALVMAPAAVYELMNVIPLALQSRALVRESAARIDALIGGELPSEIPVDGRKNAATDKLFEGAGARHESRSALIFNNVSARYPAADRDAIAGINFSLERGEILVVRGESGSGKSTIARLLVRFLNYQGSILLDGAELNELELSAVRQTIGLSEQNPHIFEGTLRDNLLIADLRADDSKLLEMLKLVGLDAWAEARDGLDTQLGVLGSMISGGQAQRIALARVLLADFDIVIFDEPTSEVDPFRAQSVIDEMLAVVHGKTVILITHDNNLRLPPEAKTLRL